MLQKYINIIHWITCKIMLKLVTVHLNTLLIYVTKHISKLIYFNSIINVHKAVNIPSTIKWTGIKCHLIFYVRCSWHALLLRPQSHPLQQQQVSQNKHNSCRISLTVYQRSIPCVWSSLPSGVDADLTYTWCRPISHL